MTRNEIQEVILKKISQLGRFPKIAELAEEFGINPHQTKKILKSLVADGFLVTQGNWYRLAKNPPVVVPNNNSRHTFSGQIAANQEVSATKESTPEVKFISVEDKRPVTVSVERPVVKPRPQKIQEQEQKTKTQADRSIAIIRLVMGLVATSASVLSFYFTFKWLSNTLPPIIAALLSGSMIGFTAFAFEVILLFLSRLISTHWSRWIIVLGFSILWIVVAGFSITTTIALQYSEHNRLLTEQAEEAKEVAIAKIQWELVQERKRDLNDRIKEKVGQLNQLTVATAITDIGGKVWEDHQWRLTVMNRDIAQLTKDLEAVRNEERALLEKNPEATTANEMRDVPDFYGWVAGILKVRKNSVQFWMSVLPAIFVDFIAPTALGVSLFLKKRQKKTRES